MTNVRGVPVALLLILAVLSAGAALLPPAYLSLGILAVPLIGVIVGTQLPPRVRGKTWGLAVSASTLLASISMALQYDWAAGGYQFNVGGPEGLFSFEIGNARFAFLLGVDQISLMLVLLTAALHPLAVTASLRSVHARSREHYTWMNFLLIAMLGVFMARDLLLFYAFFEMSLIPLFFIVGIWGGKDRAKAAFKLFLYTFVASVFMLAGVVYLGWRAGTFDLNAVTVFAQTEMGQTEKFWVLLSLLAAFAVKTPLFPLHTWLPLAHTEAPTAGSVDLAALVLKLGTYGLLRIALPIGLIGPGGDILFPVVWHVLAILCLIGIIYAALVAWVQRDIKKIIAYSSVSHLGFCVLGMLALNPEGMGGSVLYMINHGIVSGALFLTIGMIYNRFHTRDIDELGGLARAMPRMAFFMVLFTLAAVGLPGLNGFVSEFLTILGAFKSDKFDGYNIAYGVVAATGIVLGAIYMLHLVARILFGELTYPVYDEVDHRPHVVHPAYVPGQDITGREVLVLTPLALAVVVLGVFPTPMLRAIERPLEDIRMGRVTPIHQVQETPGAVAGARDAVKVVALGTESVK